MSTLAQLFDYLDGLHQRPLLDDLAGKLGQLDLAGTLEELTPRLRFSDAAYQRISLREGRHYHVWVMCWKNGQRSPIHDHAASCCALRVLRGTATDTQFAFAPHGHVKAVGSRELAAGSVCATQDSDLHQISNLQDGTADLVTLHVYSPPLTRMNTYSIVDLLRGEDVWVEERRMVTAAPENSEMLLENVRSWVTPNRLFFVRNHFDEPAIDMGSWRLRVEGCVRRPREWTIQDLLALPQRSVFATVECAGNGRSLLAAPMPGVQWGSGAIGHAEWTGVPLASVLEQAGLEAEALEIVFEGADRGSEADHPQPMHFARSLTLEKALDPDTLLVHRMNGEPLRPNHGFPLRLFVPGWYGVASVKWLRRIEAIDHAFQGYYQTVKYTVKRRSGRGTLSEVVGPMAVKSEIIRPPSGAALGSGTNRLSGLAWAGEEAVAGVDVSVDGGLTWRPAQLIGPQAKYSWNMWEYLWEVAEPGDYQILSRAISTGGRIQPTQHDALNGGYLIHHSRPVSVRVEARQHTQAERADLETLLYDMNAYAERAQQMMLDVELEFSAGEGI
jgi:DMSO/TMAO reductase YedYZ molybdopterin-dependent catalytic subunit